MKKLLTLIPIITILVLVASCAPPPAAVAEPATQAPAAEQPAAEQPAVEQPAAEAPSGMYAGLEAAQTGERQQYAYVSYVTGIPYWLDGLAGMEAAAKLLGVDFQFYGPTDLDSQAQAKIVDELVAKGVDGIVISPYDPDILAGPAERAMAAGIPVVMVISDINSPKGVGGGSYGWLGGLNYGVGVTGGNYIAENFCKEKDPCEVGILTMTGVTVHEERKTGYVETLAKYPNIKVVEIADTQADPNIGLQKGAEIIQKYPGLDVLVGTDSVGGAAAARSVIEAGKVGEINIIAMDRDVDLLNYIKDGVVDATIASKSFTTKFMALHYVYWLRNDFMADYLDWKEAGINPIPTITDTGNMLITKDNIDFFLK